MRLQEILGRLLANWQCKPEDYPPLQGSNAAESARFKRTHVMLHLQKALGRLAEGLERQDHGSASGINMAEIVTKLIGGAMQLAAIDGIPAEDIAAKIRFIYPARYATATELHLLMMSSTGEFFEAIGCVPVIALIPTDGQGLRIRVGLQPGSPMPPSEIEFFAGEEIVRAKIEPYIETEEAVPYEAPQASEPYPNR